MAARSWFSWHAISLPGWILSNWTRWKQDPCAQGSKVGNQKNEKSKPKLNCSLIRFIGVSWSSENSLNMFASQNVHLILFCLKEQEVFTFFRLIIDLSQFCLHFWRAKWQIETIVLMRVQLTEEGGGRDEMMSKIVINLASLWGPVRSSGANRGHSTSYTIGREHVMPHL